MNRVEQFFGRPIVGILGSISSIVGVALAVVFFLAARGARELVYTVHPVRSILAEAGVPGSLELSYQGTRVVGRDVVAVRVAIWNDGKLAIRPENVLDPVVLKLGPEVDILSARLSGISRDITELRCVTDSSAFAAGQVPIRWKILEHGDGAVLEVIYAGPKEQPLALTGVVEGQGAARMLATRAKILSPSEQYAVARDQKGLKLQTSLLLMAAFGIMTFWTRAMRRRRGIREAMWQESQNASQSEGSVEDRALGLMQGVLFVIWLLSIAAVCYGYWDWRSTTVEPPFGF